MGSGSGVVLEGESAGPPDSCGYQREESLDGAKALVLND